MKYLFDTHVVLWFLSTPDRLSTTVLDIVFEPTDNKFVSIASAWELAIKISIGKLTFEGGVADFLHMLGENGFSILPVKEPHVCLVETLPPHHRDPFDRMLVAAAIHENMRLITLDANLRRYENVTCVW